MTGFARSRSHICRSCFSTSSRDCSPSASTMRNSLPARTSSTPANPSELSECWMAFPCGSRTDGLSSTMTVAFMRGNCKRSALPSLLRAAVGVDARRPVFLALLRLRRWRARIARFEVFLAAVIGDDMRLVAQLRAIRRFLRFVAGIDLLVEMALIARHCWLRRAEVEGLELALVVDASHVRELLQHEAGDGAPEALPGRVVAAPVHAGPHPAEADVVGEVVDLRLQRPAAVRLQPRMRAEERRHLLLAEEEGEDLARCRGVRAVSGWIRRMARRARAHRLVLRVRIAALLAGIGTEVVGRIELVGAVEKDGELLLLVVRSAYVLDRPFTPRRAVMRRFLAAFGEPLVVPGRLQCAGDGHVERRPHQRLPRRRPVARPHQEVGDVPVIEPGRLALHGARQTAPGADHLLAGKAVHEHSAERIGAEVPQLADRTAAASLRQFAFLELADV